MFRIAARMANRRPTHVKFPSFRFARPAPDVEAQAATALLEMIDRTLAVIRFTPEGEVVECNKIFLDTMGYARAEVIGRHHSMFVDPELAQSAAYCQFWSDLKAGKPVTDQFPRVARGGRVVRHRSRTATSPRS